MDKLSESATTPRSSDPTTNFSNTSMPAETAQQRGVQNSPTPPNKWTVHVCPTTGGQFDIKVSAEDSIDNIKKCISKRLKISKERISLLHKERLLKEGTLTDNGVSEGGKITLLPNVESGLMSQRQENSVMQALENLSEPQVNDFLAGKSPLTLAMRLGDHMMFVQLQLSTSQSSSKRTTSSSSSSKHRSSKHSGSVSSSSQLRHPATASTSSTTTTPHLQQQQLQQQQHKQTMPSSSSIVPQISKTSLLSASSSSSTLGKSSKVVVPVPVHAQPRSTSHPYAACLPRRSSANPTLKVPAAQLSAVPQIAPQQNGTPGQSGIQKPATGETAPKPEKLDGVPMLDSSALAEASRNLSKKLKELSAASSTHIKAPVDVKQKKKVKKTNITEPVKGAIIESMQHHGQGVYSGTFSGTLNPALQDRNGKPKKSVSTIIHILNDLLGASPQYRAQMVHQQRHARHAERLARASHRAHASKSSDQIRRQENRATRGKMEQLQMMMKERQQRRKARREARASPYLPSWSSPNASQIAQMSTTHNTSTHSGPMEVDANLEAAANNVSENMTETNGYSQQLQTETVVA